jgi:hypothetical protein
MRVWRALGYDGHALIVIPFALVVYWWRETARGSSIEWLGVFGIFVMAWVYSRIRSGREQ